MCSELIIHIFHKTT